MAASHDHSSYDCLLHGMVTSLCPYKHFSVPNAAYASTGVWAQPTTVSIWHCSYLNMLLTVMFPTKPFIQEQSLTLSGTLQKKQWGIINKHVHWKLCFVASSVCLQLLAVHVNACRRVQSVGIKLGSAWRSPLALCTRHPSTIIKSCKEYWW